MKKSCNTGGLHLGPGALFLCNGKAVFSLMSSMCFRFLLSSVLFHFSCALCISVSCTNENVVNRTQDQTQALSVWWSVITLIRITAGFMSLYLHKTDKLIM